MTEETFTGDIGRDWYSRYTGDLRRQASTIGSDGGLEAIAIKGNPLPADVQETLTGMGFTVDDAVIPVQTSMSETWYAQKDGSVRARVYRGELYPDGTANLTIEGNGDAKATGNPVSYAQIPEFIKQYVADGTFPGEQ